MRTVIERVRRLAVAARASEELAGGDREARDAAIEAAELAGYSVREIADASRYSVARVHGIVVDRRAARQARQVQAARLGGAPQGPTGTN